MGVKMKDGYICRHCGELDRELLDSHHKKPKSSFPEKMLDIENGECTCLLDHALIGHKGQAGIQVLILMRLIKILAKRLFGVKSNMYLKCVEFLGS